MNWESGVFCKMYKSNKYKFNPPKYFNLTDNSKSSLKNIIENQLNDLCLNQPNLFEFNLNIKVNGNNQSCCLYNLAPDNKNYYFSYLINFNFYLYYNLISYGRKLHKNKNNSDKAINSKWESYLSHLLFLRELNTNLLLNEIKTNLNSYFKLHCFILEQASYLDIILLSIIIDLDLFDQILNCKENDESYIYFKRWILSMTKIYEISPEKIKSFYKNKESYFVYNTYKLTSCQKLAEAVKQSNYTQTEDLLLNFHENVESRIQDENKTTKYYKTFKSLAHLACSNKDKKMLSILIKYGCNLESKDNENMTPIYDAIYTNDVNFVDYLIKDLKVNLYHKEIQNRTPFYWACCSCSTEMIKYLMTYPNIDINSLSSMGRSALSKACWNGNTEVVKLLCSDPSINTINTPDCNKRCPLHNAVWGEFGGREGKKVPNGLPSDSPESAEILIEKGALLNVKDSEGNTPLMIAASTNGIRSMKVLMKYNIDLNEENNNHETALIQAIRYGNYESVLTFIEYYKKHLNDKNNVDLDKPDHNGITPIYYSIIYGKILCLKPLIENVDTLGYNSLDKIKELIEISIESKSKLCFNYLIRKMFKEYKPNDSEILNILKKILIYEELSFFNFLYDILGEDKVIKLINTSNNELILFLLILESQIYKNYSEPKNDNNNKNDKKLSEDEKEKVYDDILKRKMSSLSDVEIELLDNQEDTMEDKAEFLNKFNNILSKICTLESQNKELNLNLISYLIVHNKEKEFLCLKPVYSIENINCIEFNKISFNKDDYIIYIPEKHKLIKDKLFLNDETIENNIIPNSISYLNETNLLFILIEKSNKTFFNELINIKYLYHYFFDIIKSSRKNILHILFDNFTENKFTKIISILEFIANNENNINIIKDKFLPLFNQNDTELMTPLDIIINRQDEKSLKFVMDSIHDLCKKYSIENDNKVLTKSFKYYITKFNINKSSFDLESSYIQNKSSELFKCKKFIQKYTVYKYNTNNSQNKDNDNKKVDNCSFEDVYLQSKYFINEECINNAKIIIDLILNEQIEDEFKIMNQKYLHSFIETEEKLAEMSKELSNEKVLGIDAEFDGEKCEIDGVVATIQISTFKKSFVIDSLKLHNLIKKYLGDIFENENILKIFHGCSNDLSWILSNFEIKTNNVYDTAESFVVYQELILNKSFKNSNHPSLYYLVVFFLRVKLNKIYQTSNWKIRPLTEAMYQYALNDAKSVLYLYYIMQGLYAYLNKIYFVQDDKYKEYFYNIKKLFFKDREDVTLVNTEYPEGYYKNILVKIRFNCLEMILNKLKKQNIKINIELEDLI